MSAPPAALKQEPNEVSRFYGQLLEPQLAPQLGHAILVNLQLSTTPKDRSQASVGIRAHKLRKSEDTCQGSPPPMKGRFASHIRIQITWPRSKTLPPLF